MTAAIWLAFALSCGLAVGLAIPLALESALDIFGIALAALIFIGVFAIAAAIDPQRSSMLGSVPVHADHCSALPLLHLVADQRLTLDQPLRIVLAILLVAWLYALRVSPVMQPRLMAFIRATAFLRDAGFFVATQALASRHHGSHAGGHEVRAVPALLDVSVVRHPIDGQHRAAAPDFFTVFIAFAAFQCTIGFCRGKA